MYSSDPFNLAFATAGIAAYEVLALDFDEVKRNAQNRATTAQSLSVWT